VSVETEEDLRSLRAAGRVVADALRAMTGAVRPGVTTAELDAIAGAVLRRAGARSGPQLDYGFPGVACISVNDEAVHGIPGPRRLRDGDLVKLDVTAELGGYYADACRSVPVGRPRPAALRLIRAAERALARGMAAARPGAPVNAIGAAVERSLRRHGVAVCPDLYGHGVGRRVHEAPDVPHWASPLHREPLTEGLVITIEPVVSAGSGALREAGDGWTVLTADGALSAQVEETIVVRHGAPLVMTA
jgi:methionyl aminopeptidase